MKEVLDALVDGKSFEVVLEEFQLSKYELLASLRKELLSYQKDFNLEQMDQLRTTYLSSYSMVDLTGQKVMLVSDTHFASKKENPDYFPMVLNFCHNHGIFYLFHAGDIGDGLVEADKNYQTPMKQCERILDVYLEDESIRQYLLGGNHDYKYLEHGIDLLKVLSSEKKNVFPLGYTQSYFTVFGYPISFEHYSKKHSSYRLVEYPFVISGHAHKSRFADNFIKLPTLSDDIHYKNLPEGVPGFVVMETTSYEMHFDLTFSRYFFDSLEPRKEEAYTYQFVKKL